MPFNKKFCYRKRLLRFTTPGGTTITFDTDNAVNVAIIRPILTKQQQVPGLK